MIGAGVSIRLRAVQIITYVEGASGAGKFGFDEVEDGFTIEEDVPVVKQHLLQLQRKNQLLLLLSQR